MARRASAASVSVLPPSISAKPPQSIRASTTTDAKPAFDGRAPPKLGRTASSSVNTAYDHIVSHNGATGSIDTDELFVKYTVSQVKSIQQRLR